MSVTSITFLLAALVTVSVVIQVIDAQGFCPGSRNCTLTRRDRDESCKISIDYVTCLEANGCYSEAETARKDWSLACVIYAQGCQSVWKCSPAVEPDDNDKDELCKFFTDYITCLEDKGCDSGAETARKEKTKRGCSGSGAPVLSFLTMVLGVTISIFF